MRTFSVEAKVETTADPVSLKIEGDRLKMSKNGDVWLGTRERDLPDNISIAFRASGFFMTAWKLSISFTDGKSGTKTKYEKSGNIPASQLTILNDAVALDKA